MNEPTAFQRLNPIIQEELYRMKWTALRSIQVDAIPRYLEAMASHHFGEYSRKDRSCILPILSR